MPTYGSMTDSPHPSPRSAQEQTLGAMSGPGQDIYGPVPVHQIGQGWSPDATQGVRRPSSTQSPYGQSPNPSLNNEELVLITNNQLMTDTSEFGSSVGALTRTGVDKHQGGDEQQSKHNQQRRDGKKEGQ